MIFTSYRTGRHSWIDPRAVAAFEETERPEEFILHTFTGSMFYIRFPGVLVDLVALVESQKPETKNDVHVNTEGGEDVGHERPRRSCI